MRARGKSHPGPIPDDHGHADVVGLSRAVAGIVTNTDANAGPDAAL